MHATSRQNVLVIVIFDVSLIQHRSHEAAAKPSLCLKKGAKKSSMNATLLIQDIISQFKDEKLLILFRGNSCFYLINLNPSFLRAEYLAIAQRSSVQLPPCLQRRQNQSSTIRPCLEQRARIYTQPFSSVSMRGSCAV